MNTVLRFVNDFFDVSQLAGKNLVCQFPLRQQRIWRTDFKREGNIFTAALIL